MGLLRIRLSSIQGFQPCASPKLGAHPRPLIGIHMRGDESLERVLHLLVFFFAVLGTRRW